MINNLFYKKKLTLLTCIIFISPTNIYAKSNIFSDKSNTIPFENVYFGNGSDGVNGAAWFDYDNDGDDDLYLLSGMGGENALFRNNGNHTFDNITIDANIGNNEGNSSVVAADFNNDGFIDLLLTGDGGLMNPNGETDIKLYKNLGNGTFQNISHTIQELSPITHLAASAADIDNDGDLDIFIAAPGNIPNKRQDPSKLLRNDGNFQFTDITSTSGIVSEIGACVVGFSDYNHDKKPDLFIGNCNDVFFKPTPIQLYKNNGNGTFDDVSTESGLDQVLGFWMSMTFGDFDNNGQIDIFLTNVGNTAEPETTTVFPHALLKNMGDGTFVDVAESVGVADLEFGWGAIADDINNDGKQDIFFAGNFPPSKNINEKDGNPGRLFINKTNRKRGWSFKEKTEKSGFDFTLSYATGIASADYDADGFIDFVVSRAGFVDPGTAVLMHNRQKSNNHWLGIKLKAKHDNFEAIGARIELYHYRGIQTREIYAGSGFGSTHSKKQIFGLGKSRVGGLLHIYWPSGREELFYAGKINKYHTLVEGRGLTTHYPH